MYGVSTDPREKPYTTDLVVCSCETQDSLVVTTPHTLELVEDAVILVEIAQFPPKVVVDRNRLKWSVLHVDVPDLEVEVVARQDIPTVATELHI